MDDTPSPASDPGGHAAGASGSTGTTADPETEVPGAEAGTLLLDSGDEGMPRPLTDHPAVRVGVYAWSLVGMVLVIVILGIVTSRLSLLVIPAFLALFPAALLAPPVKWLKSRGLRPALATVITLLVFIALLGGIFGLLVPVVADEIEGLRDSIIRGFEQLRSFLEEGPLGFPPVDFQELVDRGREFITNAEGVRSGVMTAAVAVVEGITGLVLALVVLFFYLKDGERIGAWLRDLFPQRTRSDVSQLGGIAWDTFGSYIRGQLFVAFVDAVLIGIGLWILQVPLALPLAVLVFFGGLFPIVGAFVSGSFAVLVALADQGLLIALIVLGIIIGVQQLEGNLLAPIVLGRATALHPLAVILALTGGGILLGVLGAFIAVPITATLARGIGYLRARIPG